VTSFVDHESTIKHDFLVVYVKDDTRTSNFTACTEGQN